MIQATYLYVGVAPHGCHSCRILKRSAVGSDVVHGVEVDIALQLVGEKEHATDSAHEDMPRLEPYHRDFKFMCVPESCITNGVARFIIGSQAYRTLMWHEKFRNLPSRKL